jgi:uncharacterized membrane protein
MALAYGFHAYGPGWGFGLGFLNLLGTILFFVAMVWVIRLVMRGGFRSQGCGGWRRWRHDRFRTGREVDGAVEEARSRLARGEIDAAEFERLRSALAGGEGTEGGAFERWLGGGHDAMELLRLRLVRGEISVEEFHALRRALEG